MFLHDIRHKKFFIVASLVHTHARIHIHVHMHVHVHTHTHIHTHKHNKYYYTHIYGQSNLKKPGVYCGDV